jgi:hypothetical protein
MQEVVMGLFENFLSEMFGSGSSHNDFYGGVNIDGTPMVDANTDINGDVFGCPSSICNTSSEWEDSTSGFSSFNDDW